MYEGEAKGQGLADQGDQGHVDHGHQLGLLQEIE
jgi:hypothetical protein